MSLYNKYRPDTFGEMVAQEVEIKAITEQLETGKFSHAYIMAGQRGTGKTTTSKLFTKFLACESPVGSEPCNQCEACLAAKAGAHPDIREIDGASNNSVSDVRDIIDDLKYPPVKSKYKMYIIDEVHMLSASAFNALLTTIEQPPAHAVFIFATTELHKIPATIRSRCQIFTFSQIDSEQIANRLLYVADKESIHLASDGAKLIADNSEGSMRDALSILEQLSHNPIVDSKVVLESLGLIDESFTSLFVEKIMNKDTQEAISIYQDILKKGKTASQLIESIIMFVTSMILKGINVVEYSKFLKNLLDFKREVSKEKNIQLLFNLFIVDQCASINHSLNANKSSTDGLEARVFKIENFIRNMIEKKVEAMNRDITKKSEPVTVQEKKETPIKEPVKMPVKEPVKVATSNNNGVNHQTSQTDKVDSILKKLSGFNIK